MLYFLKMLATPEFFYSIIRISAPILFATLAAVVVEKAGFANIGLEGLMMFAALSGSLVSYYAGSWFWGFLAALATGVIMSLVMGFFAFKLKTDIILVGIAVFALIKQKKSKKGGCTGNCASCGGCCPYCKDKQS